MSTSESQQRAARLDEVLDILRRIASAEDKDLVLALAPVIYHDMPERLATIKMSVLAVL